jgi:hypothetical protein
MSRIQSREPVHPRLIQTIHPKIHGPGSSPPNDPDDGGLPGNTVAPWPSTAISHPIGPNRTSLALRDVQQKVKLIVGRLPGMEGPLRLSTTWRGSTVVLQPRWGIPWGLANDSPAEAWHLHDALQRSSRNASPTTTLAATLFPVPLSPTGGNGD